MHTCMWAQKVFCPSLFYPFKARSFADPRAHGVEIIDLCCCLFPFPVSLTVSRFQHLPGSTTAMLVSPTALGLSLLFTWSARLQTPDLIPVYQVLSWQSHSSSFLLCCLWDTVSLCSPTCLGSSSLLALSSWCWDFWGVP